ncbi:uncharacterized protein LOC133327235 [Musca vetustissima]|uniref:uncharacterized protein LOC133327235 n=1 Tax=Musca vetustissima TaxID=27455 RepID=UPI002AB7F003|nr:uncharacterized protein LOC133327235 [Musca vetustissima]
MEYSKFLLYSLLIFLNQFTCSLQERKKVVVFLKTDTNFNPVYVSNYTLTIANENSTINLDLILIKNITDPLWNLISLEIKFAKENIWSQIMKYDLNYCELLQQSRTPMFNLLSVWISNVRKYGTLPKECPILVGHYSWRNFKLDKHSIPHFVVKGFYRIGVFLYLKRAEQKEMVINSTVDIVVKGR